MFWRSRCCYHCSRHHAGWIFVRGMAAMMILITAVVALLDFFPAGRSHPAQPHHGAAASPRAPQRRDAASEHARAAHREPGTTRTPATPGAPGSRASLASAGRGLTWTSFHGIIDLPSSATAGPWDTRGGLARGYADTPAGALVAAINIAVRTSAWFGPVIFRPTIKRQVTGPDKATLLQAENYAYRLESTTPSQPASNSGAVETAYRFAAYNPAGATVGVVATAPDTSGTTTMTVIWIAVAWRHGDWRVIAPPGGDWTRVAAPVSSLSGYTTFTGTR